MSPAPITDWRKKGRLAVLIVKTIRAIALILPLALATASAERTWHSPSQAELLRTAQSEMANSRFSEAEPIWRRLIQAQETARLSNDPALALSLNELGVALIELGRGQEAEALFRRAIAIRRARRETAPSELEETAYNLARLLFDLRRERDAIPFAREALAASTAMNRATGEAFEAELLLLSQILSATNQYAEAEALAQDTLDLAEARLGPSHPQAVFAALKLSESIRGQNQFERAARLLQTRMGADFSQNRNGLADLQTELSAVFVMTGRYTEADTLLHQALATRLESVGGSSADTAYTIVGLGASAIEQSRFEAAEQYFRRALVIDEAISPSSLAVARDLDYLGLSLFSLQRYEEATRIHARALRINLDAFGENSAEAAGSYNNIAMSAYKAGYPVHAEGLFRRALAVWTASVGENSPFTARTLTNLATLLSEQGKYGAAESFFLRALNAMEATLGPNHTDVATLLTNLAASQRAQGRYADSLVLSRRAARILSEAVGAQHRMTVRAYQDIASSELSLGNPAGAFAAIELVAASSHDKGSDPLLARMSWRCAWDLWRSQAHDDVHLRELAFLQAQHSPHLGAPEALAAAFARIAAGREGLGDVVERWNSAQDSIASLDDQLARAAADGASGGTRSEADVLRVELSIERARLDSDREEQERQLTQRFPAFFDLITAPPLSLRETQALLDHDEALLVFTAGDSDLPAGHRRGLVFAVTRERSAWAEIPLEPDALGGEIAALHASLQAGGATRSPGTGSANATLSGALAFDRGRAHRLYQALFGAPEIAALVADKTRWTLAPQGMLLSAPFAALVTQPPAGEAESDFDPATLRATHWLGLERTLSVTPSVSALRTQRRNTPSRPAGEQVAFFGVGDPAFDGAPGPSRGLEMRNFFSARTGNVDAVRALPRLRETRVEIEELARAFGASRNDYVLDVAATESELTRRSDQIAHAEVIAFATHGLMAGDLSGSLAEPALALTPPAQATDADDGLLTASEAARLRLTARWVILSACNTAAGGEPDAEGLSGLARAFFYAGARTLLVSQWPVNDTAAQRLTTLAVELQRGQNLSAAMSMRQSMAALMADASRDTQGQSFAHPSAWAPFVLVSGE
jgi:CHAT domain-containing protein/tetratricopeptide (TPR) repeat protein